MDELKAKYMTLTEASQILKDADKGDLYVKMYQVEGEPGKWLIPENIPLANFGTQAQGKLYEKPSSGINEVQQISRDAVELNSVPTDNTDASMIITTDQFFEILAFVVSFNLSSDVATRTVGALVNPNLTVAGIAPTDWYNIATFTLTASQTGFLWWPGGNSVYKSTNGTIAAVNTDESLPPLKMMSAGYITANISANKQTADRSAVSAIARRIG